MTDQKEAEAYAAEHFSDKSQLSEALVNAHLAGQSYGAAQAVRWIPTTESTPDCLPGKDYSENVFTTDGKNIYVMAYCYEHDAGGFLWGNCYGEIDGDPQTDDEYSGITHWRLIPSDLPPPPKGTER